MSTDNPRYGLRGRQDECLVLDRLVETVRSGQSQVLVVRGDPGAGKSALLGYIRHGASGCRVAHAVGVEYEMELAYAGLHQLCAPMLSLRERLPEPQRLALETAFGLRAETPPDRFAVGLAVLGLLSEAAEEQPLICVVDDAQWLDEASALTIAFVARRLLAESVGLVFAVRRSSEMRELAGLPQVILSGLKDKDARGLLDAAWPGRLDDQVRDRVIAESHGNPLALLELPRGLSPAELAGGFELPNASPLTNQLERNFLRQVEALPEETRLFLLTAAAEPVGDVALLWRAVGLLGLRIGAGVPAQEAGLIELGAYVRFRHPLVRSAVYRTAPTGDRLKVHAALAEATDAEGDADRRAWHRGHAAAGLDESVADELERSAGRARARGGIAAAAAFLQRAAELTPDPGGRGRRALAAAEAQVGSGALEGAQRLLAMAEAAPLDGLGRAQLARLRAQIVFAVSRGVEAPPVLLDAAEQLAPYDAVAARETYLDALGATVYVGRIYPEIGPREVAAAVRKAPPGQRADRPADLLLDGLATLYLDGYVAGIEPLQRATEAFAQAAGDDENDVLRWFWLPWLVAGELWDDTKWHELSTKAVRLCRESGALTVLPLALGYRAFVHLHAGEFAAASTLLAEGDGISAATGGAPVRYPALMLEAWRGGEPDAVMATFVSELAGVTERGEGRGISGKGYATALLNNAIGHYDAALAEARVACEYADLGIYGLALIELIEAGSRCDAYDEAADALRRLTERTTAAGTDWALGVQAWSQAMLSDGETADALYREAIARLERTRVIIYLARVRLSYGEWLRRESRRVDAREQLRAAYDVFSRIGAQAFAERARRELSASGETARKRGEEPRGVLTRQESQIARLAREGLSNPEIGAELYLSRHTVEWHLRKVYAKLEISSRNQLGHVPISRLESA
ncbi:AAA family ATPase [Kribbella sp. NBC_00662]|uniref:ATP-binding protein n=1 Tax=Kribbella sp. NBC_00662 TaxID=2975969 RepID=UPI0032532075